MSGHGGAWLILLAGTLRRTDGRLDVTAVDGRMVGCEDGDERSTGRALSAVIWPASVPVTTVTGFVSGLCYCRMQTCRHLRE